MKIHYLLLSILAILCLELSCSDDDELVDNSGLGLLSTIEEYVNGDLLDKTTEVTYDANQRVSSLKVTQGNFLSVNYAVNYVGDEIKTLTNTQDFRNTDTTIIVNYAVAYQNDQIILTPTTPGNKYVLSTTDNYIISFKNYFGPNHEYYYESIFTRDQNNNIDTISHFATNETDTDLLVWEYTYSDFASATNLNAAFNPVYSYSYSLYDPFIGFVLNLKISDETPLKCSYLNGNGTYIQEYITAEISAIENGRLKEFAYTYQDLPANNYHLAFQYY